MPSVCILSSVHSALDNRVFYREARSLHQAGYDVTLIAVHDRDETKDGVRIIGLPLAARWRRPGVWRRLLRLARETGADIYHFHDPELLLVTPCLRIRTGAPTIYDVHESYADFVQVKEYIPGWLRSPTAWVVSWLEPMLAHLQSALVYSDDQIAASFANHKAPMATLFNYPSREFVNEGVAASRALARDDPVVLYLGGLERNRGARLMVDAFNLVWTQIPEARLLVVGHFAPPELEHEVRALADEHGISGAVTLTGRVPFEEIGGYLQRAAVGWVPWQPVTKNQKNVPTKLFEYMAYGLPVVSSDLPSTRGFVRQGENGYLVAADDAKDHAQAIIRLLRDPIEAARLGRAGQQKVLTTWNWDPMEQRLLALYEELLS